MSASPLTIRIMLACYVSSEPMEIVGKPVWQSPAAMDVRDWLFDNGLISSSDQATEKGKAWVEAICATPLPVQTWVIPDRKPAA